MHRNEIECFANTGQHAKRQHIDLHQAERGNIVFVPFNESALIHCGIADGHGLVESSARQHKAADMLREMTWRTDQFLRQFHHLFQARIRWIKSGAARLIFRYSTT